VLLATVAAVTPLGLVKPQSTRAPSVPPRSMPAASRSQDWTHQTCAASLTARALRSWELPHKEPRPGEEPSCPRWWLGANGFDALVVRLERMRRLTCGDGWAS
jgi:hypothetical protein